MRLTCPAAVAALVALGLAAPAHAAQPLTLLGGQSTTVASPVGVAAADLDQDGDVDIAAAGCGPTCLSGTGTGDLEVFQNLGAGQIATPVSYGPTTANGSERFVALGDATGDGDPDLVSIDFATDGSRVLELRPGAAGTTFGVATQQALNNGTQPSGLAVANLKHDNDRQLVTERNGFVEIYTVHSGVINPTPLQRTAAGSNGLVVADVNGDGWDDIVALASTLGQIEVFLNTAGTIATTPIVSSALFDSASSSQSVATAGQFTTDASTDLVVTAGSKVALLAGRGDGHFDAPVTISPGLPAPVLSLAAVDLNADGIDDLAVGAGSAIRPLLSDGHGGFTQQQFVATTNANSSLAVGDFDGDGAEDLVTGGYTGSGIQEFRQTPATSMQPLDFDDQAVGTRSAAHDVTITNTGGAPLRVDLASLSFDPDNAFVVYATTCTVVAPGASCTVTVRFEPKAAGNHLATLRLEDNTQFGNTSIDLSGVGVAASAPVKGDKGDPGTAGSAGAAGTSGAAGAKGDTGPGGAKGDTGATGPQGQAGANGRDGRDALVSCVSVSIKKTKTTITCKLTAAATTGTHARLVRSGRTVARGTVVHGVLKLRGAHRLVRGRYVLVLARGKQVTRRALTLR